MHVVPLPQEVLDVLIGANISFAVLTLMVTMFVEKPLQFSAFPSLLLVMTLFRLSLNVSATRLVLRDADAGKFIHSFGSFVVGGSLVIGLVVFAILLIIQFIVITNGAGRVAEVAARFTLDAMPGKQMAIDADLNAGMIDDEEARRRRQEIAAEADFYGAMDGASKFVKGDAMAAVIITLVNLLGGFAIGMVQKDMSFSESINTYSLLSVGDGLVSQIPALLLSVSTGLIVTRSGDGTDLGSDILRQLGMRQLPLRIAGFAALVLCLVPGLPKIALILVGGLLLLISTRVPRQPVDETPGTELETPEKSPDSPEALASDILVDPLGLELAADLIDLVDPASGGDLLDRVKALRRKVAADLGIVIPPVRTRDNLELPMRTYAITLFGVEVARGEAPRGCVLAIGDHLGTLPGEPTREPVFGLDAKWIPAELRHQAEIGGATVVDRASVITTHLSEVVTSHAGRLLGREDVRLLTDVLKRTHPVVVEELTPALLTLGEIQRVMRGLLDEQVSVRDLVRIFEALSIRAQTSKDYDGLVEAARAALGPAIVQPYVTDGAVHAISLDPVLEQNMLDHVRQTENGLILAMDPDLAQSVMLQLADFVARADGSNVRPVLACAPQLRPAIRRMTGPGLPRLPVLSYTEIQGASAVRSVGVVTNRPSGRDGGTGSALEAVTA
jgi:flagellar biosynthesis protein FlhA